MGSVGKNTHVEWKDWDSGRRCPAGGVRGAPCICMGLMMAGALLLMRCPSPSVVGDVAERALKVWRPYVDGFRVRVHGLMVGVGGAVIVIGTDPDDYARYS